MPQPPKILSRRAVASSQLFKVEAADLLFSNGEQREYEYLVAGESSAVIVVPMISDNEFLLIQEFGIGVSGYEWALPKGKVDANESFVEAANRELQEEAGFASQELHLLKCISQSPSYMQHKTQIVLARRLTEAQLQGDEPEPMAVKRHSFDRLPELLSDTDFTEARSIAALYIAREWLLAEQIGL